MIRVVQANPAMDRIEILDELTVDQVNDAIESHQLAGGKGGNVARGVRALGEPVAVYGFVGGAVGAFLRDGFKALGIEDRQTSIRDQTRVNSIVVERNGGRSTVINEPGPRVLPEEANALVEGLASDCRPGDLVTMSGSLARGVDRDFYARIVEAVRERGARSVVDARGNALIDALAARPWMVKTNASELGGAIGVDLRALDPIQLGRTVRPLVGSAAEVVVVTLGRNGALAATESGSLWARVPEVAPVNATGAGDLFLAGFAVATIRGRSTADALRLACACGLASVGATLPELPPEVDVEALARSVVLEAV